MFSVEKQGFLSASCGLRWLSRTALVPVGAVLALAPQPVLAVADPSSLTTVSGSTQSTLTSPGNLLTQQFTDRAIIQGANVDVLYGESWRIEQPSSSSALLVRVTGGSPTQILGTMSANGQVMLVNGAGVFFGQGSQVNVAGMIASTANISDQNFNSGKLVFDQTGRPDASIINKGTITARDGGLVALMAPGVQNDGVIAARGGTVALASGETFAVDFYGDGLYSFSVTQGASQRAKDENGNDLTSGVTNNGTLSAQGGRVVMTARSAKNVVDRAINTNGIVEATALHEVGGEIILDGGDGDVAVAGVLNVSGKQAGQRGGKATVVTTGKISLAGHAKVDASGDKAGGTVRIGGDAKGKGTLARAKEVHVAQGAVVDASARSGNGGDTVVWSDNVTVFSGFMDVSSKEGNGGHAEISSARSLTYDGFTDARGIKLGTLLLDPGNWTISSAATSANVKNAAELVTQLNSANVIIDTASAADQPGHLGDINVNESITWNGPGSLTLTASNDVIVNKTIRSLYALGDGSQGALTINAGRDMRVNNSVISLLRGNLTANTGRHINLNGASVSAFGGNLTFNNDGQLINNFSGNLNAGRVMSLRQNAGGNLQMAADSVGFAGSGATLTVGDGTYNQNLVINSALTVQSQNGAGSTTIAGVNGAGKAGTISVKAGVDGVAIGTAGKGFTILAANQTKGTSPNNTAVHVQSGSTGITITDNVLVTSNAGQNGLRVAGGSDVTVADTDFQGPGTAVRVNGAASNLTFGDDASTFDDAGRYFSLENGAFGGGQLDASQQTFAGVRGVDMTEAEYYLARDNTSDSETVAGVGFVFYRDTNFTTSGNIDSPDSETLDLTLFRNLAPLRSIFSYSGKTIESTANVAPFSFSPQTVNLSMLSPSAGGGEGTLPGDTTSLSDLAPAAGGKPKNAQTLSSLSPAAGGDETCANSFLGNGLDSGTCQSAQ